MTDGDERFDANSSCRQDFDGSGANQFVQHRSSWNASPIGTDKGIKTRASTEYRKNRWHPSFILVPGIFMPNG